MRGKCVILLVLLELLNCLDKNVAGPPGECFLSPKKGPCTRDSIRYFYNSTSKKCETFLYGGCMGNSNIFYTIEDCEKICKVSGGLPMGPVMRPNDLDEKKLACSVPSSKGPCHENIVRYYYNISTKSCEIFEYGGCLGNDNNFLTKEMCQDTCGVLTGLLPPPVIHTSIIDEKNPGLTTPTVMHPSVLDEKNPGLPMPTAKSPSSLGEKNPACTLPSRSGPCHKNMIRYYYNIHSKSCETFVYGGCMGNDNNFLTKEICQDTCGFPTACTLPSIKGPCNEDKIHYYYNIGRKSCETFVYGGCLGNANNFLTKELCQDMCGVPTGLPTRPGMHPRVRDKKKIDLLTPTVMHPDVLDEKNPGLSTPTATLPSSLDEKNPACTLPSRKGPCREDKVRYYYNISTKSCETFVYGGCLANENNFLTKKICEDTCGVLTGLPTPTVTLPSILDEKKRACTLPSRKGPCREDKVRYYYNISSKSCETFVYGGCLANENNFLTKKICEDTCGVPRGLPMPTVTRPVIHDEKTPGLSTPTVTLPSILDEKKRACTLPPRKGPCHEDTIRYYYNTSSKSCEAFVYGGCLANENNFLTEETCQAVCIAPRVLSSACTLPSRKGPCHEDTVRYYYNTSSKSCEAFVYGGCLGNDNNFWNKAICQYTCGVPRDDYTIPIICTLAPEKGNCFGQHTRYYYDKYTNKCKTFIYSGCSGNGNRFHNAKECMQRCKSRKALPTICQISKDSGTCSQKLIRYYYNWESKHCETFTYSGCGGNANHFHSIKECENTCNV